MMDLGASLCQAKTFTCKGCPLESQCTAAKDNPLHYPQKKVKKSVPIRQKDIVVFTRTLKGDDLNLGHKQINRYALRPRESRFLNGLWGFAEFEHEGKRAEKKLGSIVQKYSHFHLHANIYLSEGEIEGYDWFHLDEIKKLPLSQADMKVLALL
jgi:adenine-specific DNA glycosylase